MLPHSHNLDPPTPGEAWTPVDGRSFPNAQRNAFLGASALAVFRCKGAFYKVCSSLVFKAPGLSCQAQGLSFEAPGLIFMLFAFVLQGQPFLDLGLCTA